MHTERMPDGLALIIPTLEERHAGNYTCTAKYANTEELSKTVLIKTFGESMAAKNCYSLWTLEVTVTSLLVSCSQNTSERTFLLLRIDMFAKNPFTHQSLQFLLPQMVQWCSSE